MNKILLVVFASLCGHIGGQTQSAPFYCSKNFCDSYDKCLDVDSCDAGILMVDHRYQCSCCRKCISFIAEGEPCKPAALDQMCGPGLTCESNKCTKIQSECTKQQQQYDEDNENGLVGLFSARPSCDENGNFAGRKCQPGSSCYCVDKTGKRIFGEAPPSQAIDDSAMKCDCSRDYLEARGSLLITPIQFPHCLPNGNYDTLQCINQACYCMGTDYKPLSNLVPITAVEDLPCYNSEIHNLNYLRVCEAETRKKQEEMAEYARQNITVLGLETIECTPDGLFANVRQDNFKYYCADPMGNQIESFELDIRSPEAVNMNCDCARTRYWLGKELATKPVCCKNGSYKRIQCRSGLCFCVDLTTGDQDIGQNPNLAEVTIENISKLHCFSEYNPDC